MKKDRTNGVEEDIMSKESGQQVFQGQSRTRDNNIKLTLKVPHCSISETVFSQDGGSLLTLPPSHGVFTARQRMFHIGVGDENNQAWIC